MKPKVLITCQIPFSGVDLLRHECEVVVFGDQPLPYELLLEKVAECQGVIGLATDRIDAAFFSAASCLKGYANYAVGHDNIDMAEATRRGIPVSNTPDVLTKATAELAWALLFAVARRVVETDRVMRTGEWPGMGPMLYIGSGVSGKTLGIFGSGRIGTAMARMSAGFGMRILYTNESGHRNEVLDQQLDGRLVDFDELLAESDFLSLHAPLNRETKHKFDAAAFGKMKDTAYVINTARGALIKEDDLVAALRSGEIAGAGLDVYEFEPRVTPGLTGLHNVVLVPHIGSATRAARSQMSLLAARNMLAMLSGKRAENCLNPEVYG